MQQLTGRPSISLCPNPHMPSRMEVLPTVRNKYPCAPGAGEPATLQPPNIANRQQLLGIHLNKHRLTLKKLLPALSQKAQTHRQLDVNNPCRDPRLKEHDASLALTTALVGLPVSLGHTQTCNSCKETWEHRTFNGNWLPGICNPVSCYSRQPHHIILLRNVSRSILVL